MGEAARRRQSNAGGWQLAPLMPGFDWKPEKPAQSIFDKVSGKPNGF
jgi:hypothetical protein